MTYVVEKIKKDVWRVNMVVVLEKPNLQKSTIKIKGILDLAISKNRDTNSVAVCILNICAV